MKGMAQILSERGMPILNWDEGMQGGLDADLLDKVFNIVEDVSDKACVAEMQKVIKAKLRRIKDKKTFAIEMYLRTVYVEEANQALQHDVHEEKQRLRMMKEKFAEFG